MYDYNEINLRDLTVTDSSIGASRMPERLTPMQVSDAANNI